MRKLRMLLLLSASATLLAACQTTGTGVTDACGQWRPISWSSKDTPQTVDEVKGNNARRKAWCQK